MADVTGTHFSIERRALLPALSAANRIIEKRNTVPILAHVLVKPDNGKLAVTGTNIDVEVRAQAQQAGIPDFQPFAVPSALLYGAVSKFPDGCDIEFTGDSAAVTLRAGRSRLQLPILPAKDFPAATEDGFTHSFRLSAGVFSRILTTVGFAVSTEESRYYLNGIFMHPDADQLAFTATDGHQFSHMKIPAPDGCADMPGVIIPRGIINLLLHCAKAEGDVEISLSDRKIRAAFQDGVTVTSRLVDGTFPDYRRIIPSGNSRHYHVDREVLQAAVSRVSLVVGERSEGIRFAFGNDDVRLELDNPLAGKMEEAVSLSESYPEETLINLNYRYCNNVLGATDATEMRFALDTATSPCLISPVIDPEAGEPPIFIIMPMR
ncbi:DNA polymerase III subunit beta [Brucella intermedia]|uniref:DNA polymerase III subunit beta n=1 Tax=Brucella intermedia TaxID=94625 RepID=UPI00209AE4D0|nr:DNA polymerase III subunit beta [Brucella intermedia]MCO7737440.1 DNA polymerase III subunit beta [Brucella intermedia]